MASLRKALTKDDAQESKLRRNPEIDAKLDRFIQEKPDLYAHYNGLSKEDLIRKLMLGKMRGQEYANNRNQELRAWVEENPEIKEKVEEKIRNVPAENRERAFINVARSEAVNQSMRPMRIRP